LSHFVIIHFTADAHVVVHRPSEPDGVCATGGSGCGCCDPSVVVVVPSAGAGGDHRNTLA
jgi:hypothetical protein